MVLTQLEGLIHRLMLLDPEVQHDNAGRLVSIASANYNHRLFYWYENVLVKSESETDLGVKKELKLFEEDQLIITYAEIHKKNERVEFYHSTETGNWFKEYRVLSNDKIDFSKSSVQRQGDEIIGKEYEKITSTASHLEARAKVCYKILPFAEKFGVKKDFKELNDKSYCKDKDIMCIGLALVNYLLLQGDVTTAEQVYKYAKKKLQRNDQLTQVRCHRNYITQLINESTKRKYVPTYYLGGVKSPELEGVEDFVTLNVLNHNVTKFKEVNWVSNKIIKYKVGREIKKRRMVLCHNLHRSTLFYFPALVEVNWIGGDETAEGHISVGINKNSYISNGELLSYNGPPHTDIKNNVIHTKEEMIDQLKYKEYPFEVVGMLYLRRKR